MPWENTWLAAPTRYTSLRRALSSAIGEGHRVTLGGCGFWHAIVSIKKQAGEGKNALLAALTAQDIKHVVVVDDDIDVHNAMDVEWAIATRVQGDKDVIVIPGARAKPLDPSLAVTPPGVVPTGAKVGIDATIGEGIPRERFERIAYAYADTAKIGDYLKGKADKAQPSVGASEKAVTDLAGKIYKLVESQPTYYRTRRVLRPIFQTRAHRASCTRRKAWQDPRGHRHCLLGPRQAAR
jgi:2,5-furandicarboxylate decarboxylase 1